MESEANDYVYWMQYVEKKEVELELDAPDPLFDELDWEEAQG